VMRISLNHLKFFCLYILGNLDLIIILLFSNFFFDSTRNWTHIC
jgi:hypothetical protein